METEHSVEQEEEEGEKGKDTPTPTSTLERIEFGTYSNCYDYHMNEGEFSLNLPNTTKSVWNLTVIASPAMRATMWERFRPGQIGRLNGVLFEVLAASPPKAPTIAETMNRVPGPKWSGEIKFHGGFKPQSPSHISLAWHREDQKTDKPKYYNFGRFQHLDARVNSKDPAYHLHRGEELSRLIIYPCDDIQRKNLLTVFTLEAVGRIRGDKFTVKSVDTHEDHLIWHISLHSELSKMALATPLPYEIDIEFNPTDQHRNEEAGEERSSEENLEISRKNLERANRVNEELRRKNDHLKRCTAALQLQVDQLMEVIWRMQDNAELQKYILHNIPSPPTPEQMAISSSDKALTPSKGDSK